MNISDREAQELEKNIYVYQLKVASDYFKHDALMLFGVESSNLVLQSSDKRSFAIYKNKKLQIMRDFNNRGYEFIKKLEQGYPDHIFEIAIIDDIKFVFPKTLLEERSKDIDSALKKIPDQIMSKYTNIVDEIRIINAQILEFQFTTVLSMLRTPVNRQDVSFKRDGRILTVTTSDLVTKNDLKDNQMTYVHAYNKIGETIRLFVNEHKDVFMGVGMLHIWNIKVNFTGEDPNKKPDKKKKPIEDDKPFVALSDD